MKKALKVFISVLVLFTVILSLLGNAFCASDPSPWIVANSLTPKEIHLGESITLVIGATNMGGYSSEGYISVSFPESPPIEVTDITLEHSEIFYEGKDIWHKDGYQFPAKYLLVDTWDTNWENQESHVLKVKITPSKVGTYHVYVRCTMKDNDSGSLFNCPTSGPTDQQGWHVYVLTFEVVEENQTPSASRNFPNTYESTISVGESITFKLDCSDQDGNLHGIEWYKNSKHIGNTYDISGSSDTGSKSITFNNEGNYYVEAVVFDTDEMYSDPVKWKVNVIEENQTPIPDADGPYSGKVGESIKFDGSGSHDPDGNIAKWEWDFGDNSSLVYGEKPTHVYNKAGKYTVTLRLKDNEGEWSEKDTTTATITEEEKNTPPIADANGPYTGKVGEKIQFDGSSSHDPDGSVVKWEWDFGDNSPAGSGERPTHIYNKAREYTVTLRVKDNKGAWSEKDRTTVAVSEAVEKNVDGEIIDFSIDSGKFVTGDSVNTEVIMKNTGSVKHTFFIGYGVIDPSGNILDNEGTTGTTISLNPGERGTVLVKWFVTNSAPGGKYDAIIVLWKESNRNDLQTPLDKVQKKNAFEVSSEKLPAGSTIPFPAWPESFPYIDIQKLEFENMGNRGEGIGGDGIQVKIDRIKLSKNKYKITIFINNPKGSNNLLKELYGYKTSQVILLYDKNKVDLDEDSVISRVNGGESVSLRVGSAITSLVSFGTANSIVGLLKEAVKQIAESAATNYATSLLVFETPPDYGEVDDIKVVRVDFSENTIASSPFTVDQYILEVTFTVKDNVEKTFISILLDLRGRTYELPNSNPITMAFPAWIEYRRQVNVLLENTNYDESGNQLYEEGQTTETKEESTAETRTKEDQTSKKEQTTETKEESTAETRTKETQTSKEQEKISEHKPIETQTSVELNPISSEIFDKKIDDNFSVRVQIEGDPDRIGEVRYRVGNVEGYLEKVSDNIFLAEVPVDPLENGTQTLEVTAFDKSGVEIGSFSREITVDYRIPYVNVSPGKFYYILAGSIGFLIFLIVILIIKRMPVPTILFPLIGVVIACISFLVLFFKLDINKAINLIFLSSTLVLGVVSSAFLLKTTSLELGFEKGISELKKEIEKLIKETNDALVKIEGLKNKLNDVRKKIDDIEEELLKSKKY